MANKNNPSEKHEVARVVKHPGKRDRDVVATPPKPKFQFAVTTIEPHPIVRYGMDEIFRAWNKEGHFVCWGKSLDEIERKYTELGESGL